MRQEITEALSYALNKGIQIHPNALVVLEDADATNLMRVMREIIINKTRQHNSLITKDDVEAALGIKETTDVVATFDVLFDPSPNVASAEGIEGYGALFKSRYEKLRKIISQRPEGKKLKSVTSLVGIKKPNTEMYICGLVIEKNILLVDEKNAQAYPHASKDSKGRPLVGAAVGVKGDFMDRTEALLDAGADVLVVDIAHGHSENAISAIRNIKKAFPDCELVAGNVATAQGTKDLINAGVDAVKVGVGSGSICITRVITGSGVPQLTAVIECAKVGHDNGIPIISDGGTRTSGDATKALAAGASSIMVGSMLGGTDESPGSVLTKNGKRFKVYRGMASLAASLGRKSKEQSMQAQNEDDLNDYVAEGVEAMVPYKGSVNDILKQLTGGIRSGLSYCGAHTIPQMQENAEFIKIQPHDVTLM